MELIENLLQLLTTFVGALLSGIAYRPASSSCAFCRPLWREQMSEASAAAGRGSRLRSACRYWRSTVLSGTFSPI